MQKNGGNALGLKVAAGPYLIMKVSSQWQNTPDDARILAFFSTIIEKVQAEAKSKGLDNNYIHMTYAPQFEYSISSYGATNVQKLTAVSAKYDPASVFINLMLGHFKLGKGAP